MKGIRFEIQTFLLALVIITVAAVSGLYFFSSLAALVDVVHRQSRTDPVLVGVRDVVSGLTEVENSARLYILSRDANHLIDYRMKNDSIAAQLQVLDAGVPESSFDRHLMDSLRSLVLQRLIIWNEILDIHLSVNDLSARLPEFARQMMSAPPDTIEVEVPRKGFVANLFRKKKTETEIRVVPSLQADEISRELEKFQRSVRESNTLLKSREAELIEANQEVTNHIYGLIWQMESIEKARMEANTLEAGLLADSARNRIIILGSVIILLLAILILLVLKYIRRNRETQKVLVESRRQTEEFARAKEMLIANISHEMRTPVNVVYGLTSQILERELESATRSDLAIVNRSARHLASLVNDTLDLARINSSLLTIHENSFVPATILSEALELVRADARHKNLLLEFNPPENLPEVLSGDPVRLKQMLVNLLSNAIKFTDEGFVRLDVSVAPEEEGWLFTAIVSDSGRGISQEELPRVFDEFMQSAHNNPVKHRGTGLGLSIVKKLAELQGGGVTMESTPGKGTRVGFFVKYGQGIKPETTSDSPSPGGILSGIRNLKVLVVDDEIYNRHLLRMILEKHKMEVSEASDGRKALEMAGNNPFDLIFMDVRMPVMDGIEATQGILKVTPSSIIIGNSAAGSEEDVSRCLMAGMKDFLPKPYTEEQLLRVLAGLDIVTVNKVNVPAGQTGVDDDGTDSNPPPVDVTELYRISGGNRDFVLELINIFLNTTDRSIAEMHIALKENNFERLADLAHKMASPVKHIHADDLYNQIKIMERSCFRPGASVEIPEMLRIIEDQIRKIQQFLRNYIQKSERDS